MNNRHLPQYGVRMYDVELLAEPIETSFIGITGLRSTVECATRCSNNKTCNVFTLSKVSYQCKLYTYLNTCDGYISSPDRNIFVLL